ncbi:TPA: hypothetical protein DCW61_00040 [Candidatus Uhrbacteria bacterium]|nr:hypothetical protein [Candidatus Uhrbacteria bacterium]
MFESLYNIILFVLAIVGAGRFGLWLIGRRWHWAMKAIVLLLVTSVIWGFVGQMTGGPQKTDLRIVTEVLGSAGTIFSLEYLFHRIHNGWARFGLIVLAGIFLVVTWKDSFDRGVEAVSNVNPKTITSGAVPIPSISRSTTAPNRTQTAPTKTNAQLCAEGRLPFSTCQKYRY